jgi:hypothetical protein
VWLACQHRNRAAAGRRRPDGRAREEALRVARSRRQAALDRPDNIAFRICEMLPDEAGRFGFDESFLPRVLPICRPPLELLIDNYYAWGTAGVGDPTRGPAYNQYLRDPKQLDDKLFSEGFDNNHTGVQQWYRWTVIPSYPFPAPTASVCPNDTWNKQPPGLDATLDPCSSGWRTSIEVNPSRLRNLPVDCSRWVADETAIDLTTFWNHGCNLLPNTNSTLVCVPPAPAGMWEGGASQPFVVTRTLVPADAKLLGFDFSFTGTTTSDYAVVFVDDEALWNMSASSGEDGVLAEAGPLPLADLTGPRRVTVAYYPAAGSAGVFQVSNLRTLS